MEESIVQDFSMIDCIPKLITEAKNERMTNLLSKEKVKQVIFALNENRVAGPDSFFGIFF